jgi:hypothetical protein
MSGVLRRAVSHAENGGHQETCKKLFLLKQAYIIHKREKS